MVFHPFYNECLLSYAFLCLNDERFIVIGLIQYDCESLRLIGWYLTSGVFFNHSSISRKYLSSPVAVLYRYLEGQISNRITDFCNIQ